MRQKRQLKSWLNFLAGFAFVFLHACEPGWAALTDFDRQDFSLLNILSPFNSGFESGLAQWSASGGSTAVVSSGASLGFGKSSITWDSTAASQTLDSKLVSIPPGLYGRVGEVFCDIRTPSGTATHTIAAHDGTSPIASTTINSSSNYIRSGVRFTMPTSGSIKIRISSVASNEPLIALDDCYIGVPNLNNVMTSTGDLIYSSSSIGLPSRLPVGSQYQVLQSNGSIPAYDAVHLDQSAAVTGTLPEARGGTNQSTYTTGDTLYASATNTLSKRAIGSQYQSLQSNGTVPVYDAIHLDQSAATSGTLFETRGGTNQSTYTTGDILYSSAANTLSKLPIGTTNQVLTVIAGIPSWQTSASGTVTMSGATTNGVAYATGASSLTTTALGAAGTVLTGTGSAPAFSATPTFGVSGTTLGSLALAGNTSGAVTIKPQAAAGTFNFNLPTTAGSSGQFLTSGGGGTSPMIWSTGMTNPMTTTGDTIYSSDNSGTPARLAAGAQGTYQGSQGASTAPIYRTFIPPDVQVFTTGTNATYNLPYAFIITSGSATAGATYTNNSVTFTVIRTVSSATLVYMSGSGAPSSSGTLTKSTGTGDATLTFSMYAAPIGIYVEMIGGGGSGVGGGSNDGGTGSAGNSSLWKTSGGTTFLTAAGGNGGGNGGNGITDGGTGGSPTISSPGIDAGSIKGGDGQSTPSTGFGSVVNWVFPSGGGGGVIDSGTHGQSAGNAAGANGAANTGSGGAGGGTAGGTSGYSNGGAGGGAGALVRAWIHQPATAGYQYTVAAAQTTVGSGTTTNGTAGGNGGQGASGRVMAKAVYQ